MKTGSATINFEACYLYPTLIIAFSIICSALFPTNHPVDTEKKDKEQKSNQEINPVKSALFCYVKNSHTKDYKHHIRW